MVRWPALVGGGAEIVQRPRHATPIRQLALDREAFLQHGFGPIDIAFEIGEDGQVVERRRDSATIAELAAKGQALLQMRASGAVVASVAGVAAQSIERGRHVQAVAQLAPKRETLLLQHDCVLAVSLVMGDAGETGQGHRPAPRVVALGLNGKCARESTPALRRDPLLHARRCRDSRGKARSRRRRP